MNLATSSDGTNHQGRRLSRYRRRQALERAGLQAERTRSATRRLARRLRKEHRRQSRALGVGVCHRTRTLPLTTSRELG
ncbi:hypothetical protein [Streptomyces violaceusniger]|uniref:Uncharacterized protein n=1 Tax=Streptomyces violaceusniger (strain Tu 4113) TaxID=653045 RepID=G2P236_STRV4|nr:hypothetical protein [Streptomyces violaceusniger]AEM81349.1 hypothetical protein Strvi_1609 [Streptomyces violaceusniger Tu 4113]